jgi:peptidoglycan/LPS O-acetylase OafA/YrhL
MPNRFRGSSAGSSITTKKYSSCGGVSVQWLPGAATAEIKPLTGLRGVAALLVATYHFRWIAAGPGYALFSRGYLWVDVFFVLSGFVMSMTYGSVFSQRWSFADFRSFINRRLARIYPLYFVLTVMAVPFFLAFPYPGIDLRGSAFAVMVVANLTLVAAWHVCKNLIFPAWSVSAEFAAYLVFPFLVPFLRDARRMVILAVGAVTLLGLVAIFDQIDYREFASLRDGFDGRTVQPVFRCLGGFILGMICYKLYATRSFAAVTGSTAFGLSTFALFAAGSIAGVPDLVLYPLFPAMVLAVAADKGIVSRILSCRPVYYAGLLSYSLYMLHVGFLPVSRVVHRVAFEHFPPVVAQALTIVVVYGSLGIAAAAAYHIVEVPARRWLRNAWPWGRPAREFAAAPKRL